MESIFASHFLFLPILIFVVAFLYSTVGHGGASGYLAVMSLLSFNPHTMPVIALILNVGVSAIAFFSYRNAGHFKGSLLYPFLIFSVPMAWLGSKIPLSHSAYSLLLAFALLFAAFRLNFKISEPVSAETKPLNFPAALLIGGAIGFISGAIGIGGGIFLSSILLFFHWSTIKESAAVSAPFIFINSIIGLIPRLSADNFSWHSTGLYISCALVGGLLGSHLGARHFTAPVLRKILGLVLFSAAIKLLIVR